MLYSTTLNALLNFILFSPTNSAGSAPLAVAVEQHLRVNEDPLYLDGYVRRYRGCRLALAALEIDPFSPHRASASSPGATASAPGALTARRLTKLKPLLDSEIADDVVFKVAVEAAAVNMTNGILEVPVRFSAVIGSIDRVAPEHQLYNPHKPRLYAAPYTHKVVDIVAKAEGQSTGGEEAKCEDPNTPLLLGNLALTPNKSDPASYGPLEGLYGTAYGLILVLRECGVHCNPIFSKAYSVNDRSLIVKQVWISRQARL
jgi:hypothetical protein